MTTTEQLSMRPYARLLTMLGEQLIKNERIALAEIIKNSYDADADWVKITFQDFDGNFGRTDKSKIIIEDNGHGMTEDIIKNHWLNPATPEKLNRKNKNNKTAKGRIIQGEKGIGRFAMLKLGKKISVITRPKSESIEYKIEYDFSLYDNDFLTEKGEKKELFLDELRVSLTERKPFFFVEKNVILGTQKKKRELFGTYIEISCIKDDWNETKVVNIFNDTKKLTSIFFEKASDDFQVFFYQNEDCLKFRQDYWEKLNNLLGNKTVFKIENGCFNDKEMVFTYEINGKSKKLNITDPEITGLKIFNKWFGEGAEKLKSRKLECGPFNFAFYIFDFSSKAEAKYSLDREDKKIIKDHRIYLYRDGLRVYPYGEPGDDWLQIDVYRGTIAAGDFLSNDQVVGYIDISQKSNPKLKDKTNREGLIEEGNALDDFIILIQTFLTYIRKNPYALYRKGLEDRNIQDVFKTEQVKSGFDNLKNTAGNNSKLITIIDKIEKDYTTERDYLIKRFETAEDLAGVGLSVETSSHDIVAMMSHVMANTDGLIADLMSGSEIDRDQLLKELQSIRGGMSFIEAQLKDIQLLFKSSKQKRRNIRIEIVLQKIERLYKKQLNKGKVIFEIKQLGSPLVAKTTDAVLLQLFLNLMDNAIYWINQIESANKRIVAFLDGNKQQIIFSDNGPGIKKDDAPYVFDSFYSGKGEDGRGLGLYIAKQLLERQDYSIRLAEISSEKKLSGANFVIDFISGGER
jgi:signal transduction histidine kinase